jgi:hypothetical protein
VPKVDAGASRRSCSRSGARDREALLVRGGDAGARAYVTFPTREQAERFAWLGGANTLPHGRLRGNFFGATSSKRGREARLLG